MREFVDDELEGRWCGEKIIGVWLCGVIEGNGRFFAVSWKREKGRVGRLA